jgi:thioredoxin 1
MAVHQVSSRSFRRDVLESDLPVVVDFHADWCGPCHQIAPLLERLSEEWEGRVRFVKLDIDRNRDVARAYRISSIPAVLLFEGGEPRAWSLGAKPGYLIERELGLAKRRRKAKGSFISRLRRPRA